MTLFLGLLLTFAVVTAGCGQRKPPPVQLYDPGKEAQEKAIAEQHQAVVDKIAAANAAGMAKMQGGGPPK